MGQTDKQFNGFLRMVISSLKKAIAEPDPAKKKELLQELLDNLQTTLEDSQKGRRRVACPFPMPPAAPGWS